MDTINHSYIIHRTRRFPAIVFCCNRYEKLRVHVNHYESSCHKKKLGILLVGVRSDGPLGSREVEVT